MSYVLEEINSEQGNFYAEIVQDEYADSPRKEWDSFGTMYCWHGRYELGDEKPSKYFEPNDLKEYFKRKPCIILPLYLYDHSGITMNTKGFSCRWDSGQVGYIFAELERVREEYNVKRVTKKIREKVIKLLEAEVETYDQYLTGDVYGYVIKDCKTDEQLDSCWGFYGLDYIRQEVNSLLEHHEKELKKTFPHNWFKLPGIEVSGVLQAAMA